jgi:hypothetical protein
MVTKRVGIYVGLGWLLLVTASICALAGPGAVVGTLVTGSDIRVGGLPAKPGLTIMSGDSLVAGDDGGVIMVGAANRITLGARVALSFDKSTSEVLVRLLQGGLILFHPDKEETSVRVEAGDVSILPASGFATLAEVSMSKEELTIAAKKGLLSVQGDGQTVQLPPGRAIKFSAKVNSAPQQTGAPGGAKWVNLKECAAGGAAVTAVPVIITQEVASPSAPGWTWGLIPVGGGAAGLICLEIPPGGQKPPPPVCTLVANPVKEFGKLPTLTWTSQNATALNIQPGAGGVQPPTGTVPVTPPKVGTTEYVMTATGPGGVATCKANVEVGNPRCTITASPAKVYQQEFVKLSWIALAAVGNVDIQPAPGAGQSQTGVQEVRAPAAVGKVTYKLTVNGFGGTTATCQATVEVGIKCAIPVNLHQTGATALGDGTNNPRLRFNYSWESSTGNLADLGSCRVGEIVTYPGDANPSTWPAPFNSSSPNPTVIWLAGTLGKMMDTHSNKGGFKQPYKEATFTATQNYRYECMCPDGTTRKGNLLGPISIVRTVSKNADGTYTYTITKSEESASGPLP